MLLAVLHVEMKVGLASPSIKGHRDGQQRGPAYRSVDFLKLIQKEALSDSFA